VDPAVDPLIPQLQPEAPVEPAAAHSSETQPLVGDQVWLGGAQLQMAAALEGVTVEMYALQRRLRLQVLEDQPDSAYDHAPTCEGVPDANSVVVGRSRRVLADG
jgi:hypothetical protein